MKNGKQRGKKRGKKKWKKGRTEERWNGNKSVKLDGPRKIYM